MKCENCGNEHDGSYGLGRFCSSTCAHSFVGKCKKVGRLKITPINSCKFKTGFHTTWNGKQYFFRSSYEEDLCNELDSMKIDYEIETLAI